MFNPFKYSYQFKLIDINAEFVDVVENPTITLENGTKIHSATIKRNRPIKPATPGTARISSKKIYGSYVLRIIARKR